MGGKYLTSGKVLILGLRLRYCLWICLIFGGIGIYGLQPLKCPRICTCRRLVETGNIGVDCTKRNLTAIPKDLNKHTEIL